MVPSPLLIALLLDRVPLLLFSLPLIAAASYVFAATHHEAPTATWWATVEWAIWLVGILGVVLLAVIIFGRMV